MISVFNGSRRGIGGGEKHLYLQMEFDFRNYLHHFKGARLHVFMCLSLHSDSEGFSYPSYDTIQRETGYGRDTIAIALKELCDMRIEGHRVLVKWRERGEKGKFIGSNRYRIFPSQDELEAIGLSSSGAPTDDSADPPTDAPEAEPELGKSNGGKSPTLDNANSGKSLLEVDPVLKESQSKEDPPMGGAFAPIPEQESMRDQFYRLLKELEGATNRYGKLMEIYALCYGNKNLPTFDKLGAIGKKIGAGRLAELMWLSTTKQITGDPLDYIMACERNRKKGNKTNGNGRKKSTTGANTDAGQGYTQPASQTPADEAARIRAALGLVSPLAAD